VEEQYTSISSHRLITVAQSAGGLSASHSITRTLMGTVPANAIARKAISAARPRPAEPAARSVAVEDDSDDGSDDRGDYQSG